MKLRTLAVCEVTWKMEVWRYRGLEVGRRCHETEVWRYERGLELLQKYSRSSDTEIWSDEVMEF